MAEPGFPLDDIQHRNDISNNHIGSNQVTFHNTSTSGGSETPVESMKEDGVKDELENNQLAKEKSAPREDGKIELLEKDCYNATGFAFPAFKKWTILSVIFAVQVSMNLNASLYANGIDAFESEFGVSGPVARLGQMIFLVAYAFGCELWAPWSEELGRRPILQASLLLVNIWQIPCALAPNFETIVVGRFFGGLSSAGGSVTLGMVADMWSSDDQQYAVAFIVLSSVGGSVVGPIIGGFIQANLSWHWVFWVQLIAGVAVQAIHFICVPETRTSVMVDREAKRRRKAGETNIYGPGELNEKKMNMKEVLEIWARPFVMFATEPIVLFLSLLSGFSDALIFTFLEGFSPVFKQWGFGTIELGLAFIPIGIGYFIAYFSFFPVIRRHRQIRKKDPNALQPEARLWWLLWTAPLEAIGLFGFAWTSLGPAYCHWIWPLVFSGLVGIANFCIYMATIDYMIASYGPYAASATGGNGFSRDFLAGIAALYAGPLYSNLGDAHPLEWASTLLACLAILVTIPIYVFYWKGPAIRKKSPFAQELASDKKAKGGRDGQDEREKV